MWPGGHQCSQNGWLASETSTVLKPRVRSSPARKTCSSFSRSMSNASEPFVPLISHWKALRRPSASRVASSVPTAPFANLTVDSTASSTSRSGMNVLHEASDLVDLADEVAREVDDVGGEVSERARACLGAVEPPHLGVGVAPVLEVAAAEVADLAELAGVDQLAREAHRGDEAVVEGAEVLHARRRDPAPDLVALVRVAAERLLADDVLPRLGGGDRRLGVERVRAEVVEQPDRRIGHELLPVRRPALEAVAVGRLAHGRLVPPGDRDEPRPQRRRPGHVVDLAEAVRVRLAHEGVPEHPHADLVDVASHSLARDTKRLVKTSLGIWALGSMVTRFVPGGYQPQWADETMPDRVRRAVDGLGDLIDDYEFHYPQELSEENLDDVRAALGGHGIYAVATGTHLNPRVRQGRALVAAGRRSRRGARGGAARGRLRRLDRRADDPVARDRGLQLPVPDAVSRRRGRGSSTRSARSRPAARSAASRSSSSTRTPSRR